MMWERNAPFQDTIQRMKAAATVLPIGTALQGTDPSTIVLEMKNTSSVPVSWAIVVQEDEVRTASSVCAYVLHAN